MIDPEAAAVLAEERAKAKPMPVDDAAWLAGYRQALDAVVADQGEPPPCVVEDRTVERPDGTGLRCRLYRPEGTGPFPTLLYIHGGGFVAGSLEGFDIPLRHVALRSGWQITAVDYRLAPEHPYPAALEDCLLALDDVRAGEPPRIAVGGDSAGGLLATVVARRVRDDGADDLDGQILLYPNADLRHAPPYASREAHDGTIVRLDELHRSLDAYLGAADRTHPDVSPLFARDLAGLCPALLVTMELDPLRDEAEAYGARLQTAGVPVEHERMTGMIHTSLQRGGRIARGDALITRVADTLRRLSRPSVP